MRLVGIKEGDLVLVDKGGRRFHASAVESPTAKAKGELQIVPLQPRQISYRSCKPREVVEHWRKARRARP